jgi:hypothetical protein
VHVRKFLKVTSMVKSLQPTASKIKDKLFPFVAQKRGYALMRALKGFTIPGRSWSMPVLHRCRRAADRTVARKP